MTLLNILQVKQNGFNDLDNPKDLKQLVLESTNCLRSFKVLMAYLKSIVSVW